MPSKQISAVEKRKAKANSWKLIKNWDFIFIHRRVCISAPGFLAFLLRLGTALAFQDFFWLHYQQDVSGDNDAQAVADIAVAAGTDSKGIDWIGAKLNIGVYCVRL